MYTIYNESLDVFLELYKVTNLSELDDDELVDFCNRKEIKVSPVYDVDKKGRRRNLLRRAKIKREKGGKRIRIVGTIDKIISEKTASFYMDETYWRKDQIKHAEERDIEGFIEMAHTGEELFKAYEQVGFGVWQLEPGSDIELNLSLPYVKEVLLNAEIFPQATILKVTGPGIDKEKTVKLGSKSKDTGTTVKLGKEKTSNEVRRVNGLDLPALQKEAKKINKETGKKIRYGQIEREELRVEIVNHINGSNIKE